VRLGDEAVLEVYVDVVVLLNLILNGLALWGTGRLFRLRVKARRIFAGALLGALYALAVYFLPWAAADSTAMKFFMAVAMIRCVYGKQPFKTALRLVLGFYLVSFAMGGAVTALTAQKSGIVQLLGISAACVGITVGIARWLGGRRIREKWIWTCKLTDHDQCTEFCALLDTGNQLQAPWTGEWVVILERRAVPWASRMKREERVLRTVPFQTVSGKRNTLVAFEPAKFEIYAGGDWKEIRHVLVALFDAVLDRENRYQGLLPLEILNEMGEFHDEADERTRKDVESGLDQGLDVFEEQSRAVVGEVGTAAGNLLCGRQRGAAGAFERGGGAGSSVRLGAGRGGGARHVD
jgi:stage II sporulation protein GA (sporulation sigma-E factor processing peptidase)